MVFGGAGEHAAPVAGAAAPFGRLKVFQFGYGRRAELAVPEEVPEQREGVQVAHRACLCFQRAGVHDKRILSVFRAVRRAWPTGSAEGKGAAVRAGGGGERRLARGPAERALVAPVGG